MKKFIFLSLFCFLFLGIVQSSFADGVYLYVDAAPNVYGSPDYSAWEAIAFADAANGTFKNMANSENSSNVGTTNFEIQDEVVYSFGDLGKRLTWIYYIPGETISSLAPNDRFTISLENTWDGVYMDFYNSYYGSTWLEPTKWIDYDKDRDGKIDGVIGTAGMAWWGAYEVNTQEALDADIASWIQADESWTFTAKLDGITTSITSNRVGVAPVPEPTTLLLLGSGLAGLAGSRKKFKKV